MIKEPVLKRLNKNLSNSPLVKLFLILLFDDDQNAHFEIDEDTEEKYYSLDASFHNLVYSNGSPNPDDNFYVFDTVNTFQNKTSFEEKERIIFQFLDSEEAISLIYQRCEDDSRNYDEEGCMRNIDDEIFNRTKGELLENSLKFAEKGIFQDDIKKWLSDLCIRISLDVYENQCFDEENFSALLELFLKNAGIEGMVKNYQIREDEAQIVGITEFEYNGKIFKIDNQILR